MAGDWDADDPAAVLAPFAARMSSLVPAWMQRLRHFYVRHPPAREQNTRAGARRNIERHYDLSNDLFALFLDESMTYSCARFERRRLPRATPRDARSTSCSTPPASASGPGCSRSAPAGARWRCAPRAAAPRSPPSRCRTSRPCWRATRAARAGVTGRVDVQLRDYREVEGRYDAVVSVEMIEAVGTEYWPTFFRTLDRALAPGGRIGIQAILLAHDRMLATRDQYTWIQQVHVPGRRAAVAARDRRRRRATAPTCTSRRPSTFGADYARTLRAWRERFDAHAREVDALGFDATFRRMWDFYLAYCEAGFATGYLDVARIVLSRGDGSMSRHAGRRGARRRRRTAFVGGDLPVRLRAWDGSEVGPAGGAGTSCCTAAGRCATSCGAPTSSGWPAPTSPATSTSTVTSTTASAGCGRSPAPREAGATAPARATGSARSAPPCGSASSDCRHEPPASEARIRGRLPQPRSRPGRHRAPLRPVERLLRAAPRRAHGVLVRVLGIRPPGDVARRRAARQARAGVREARLGPGMRLLDVGCGWGSLSIHAARTTACRSPAITLSREQLDFARKRAADHGVGDLVDFRLQDYRDVARRAVRRGGVDRDGRARRRRAVPDVRRHRAPPARARAAASSCSRCRAPPGARPAAARSSRPTSRPTCTCARWARPSGCSKAAASRCATCRRCASTTCAPAPSGWPTSKLAGTTSSRWSARRWPGCGGSTSSAVRWRSRRAAWVSTRSSWPSPGP